MLQRDRLFALCAAGSAQNPDTQPAGPQQNCLSAAHSLEASCSLASLRRTPAKPVHKPKCHHFCTAELAAVQTPQVTQTTVYTAAQRRLIGALRCQVAKVDALQLSQFELYSSRVKDFEVRGRQSHPRAQGSDYSRTLNVSGWQLLGKYTAAKTRGSQVHAQSSLGAR